MIKTSRIITSDDIITKLTKERQPLTIKGNVKNIETCIQWYNTSLNKTNLCNMMDDIATIIREHKILRQKIV